MSTWSSNLAPHRTPLAKSQRRPKPLQSHRNNTLETKAHGSNVSYLSASPGGWQLAEPTTISPVFAMTSCCILEKWLRQSLRVCLKHHMCGPCLRLRPDFHTNGGHPRRGPIGFPGSQPPCYSSIFLRHLQGAVRMEKVCIWFLTKFIWFFFWLLINIFTSNSYFR